MSEQPNATFRTSDVHIRWMIRRDHPEVLAIEGASFARPWSERKILRAMREHRVIGCVAEEGADVVGFTPVVGFMIYRAHPRRLELMRLAVRPDRRRSGVGRRMIEKLVDKLSAGKWTSITASIRESNLDAARFLAATGFRAVGVVRDHYDDGDGVEDAYRMTFSIRGAVE